MSAITWAVVLLAGVAGVYSQGTEISLNSRPSLVQGEDRVGTFWLQHWVGVVLTNVHVLTSADSVVNNIYTNRRIRAGASVRGEGGQVVAIANGYTHPNYGQLGKDANIMVLRLAEPLIMGPTVQQASILGEGIELPVNLEVALVSWGNTAGSTNGNLHEIILRVNDNDACLNNYQTATANNPQIITENMICTGLTYNSGRDLDSRDLGSPLFYDYVVVGITSFGVSNGNNQYQVVSTAISSYTSWIVETARD